MTTTLDFPVGQRRCKDCGLAVPPPRMHRCSECLVRHLDRLRKTKPTKGNP